MKIVDVIGEKIYKDGERIITQVSWGLAQLLSWTPKRNSVSQSMVVHTCDARAGGSQVQASLGHIILF